jgi:exosortase A-associated hydrolase 1
MGEAMRRALSFACDDAVLHATLDDATGQTGVLIVSGGNEIRIGAHRGMARLAQDLAARDIPVFRFDRRGVGDSTGNNHGFESSAPDMAAAISAFRAACPQLRSIVAFGNCDAASALIIHRPAGVQAMVLANPWAFPTEAGLPPPAAIKAHYRQRLLSVAGWKKLLSGGIDLRKLARGVSSIAQPGTPRPLLNRLAQGLSIVSVPISLVIASLDATGLAFNAAFRGDPAFAAVRGRARVIEIESASHSFAPESDYQRLLAVLMDAISDVGEARLQSCP